MGEIRYEESVSDSIFDFNTDRYEKIEESCDKCKDYLLAYYRMKSVLKEKEKEKIDFEPRSYLEIEEKIKGSREQEFLDEYLRQGSKMLLLENKIMIGMKKNYVESPFGAVSFPYGKRRILCKCGLEARILRVNVKVNDAKRFYEWKEDKCKECNDLKEIYRAILQEKSRVLKKATEYIDIGNDLIKKNKLSIHWANGIETNFFVGAALMTNFFYRCKECGREFKALRFKI